MNSPTPYQSRLIWWAASSLAGAVIVALAVGAIWGLGKGLQLLSPVLWPLAAAGVLAYLLDPVVDFLVARKTPRKRAIGLVFLLVLGLFAGVVSSIVPQIYREAGQFAERVPGYVQRIQERLEGWASHPPVFLQKANELRRLFRASGSTTNRPAPPTTNTLTGQPSSSPAREAQSRSTISPDMVRSATTWFAGALPGAGRWTLEKLGQVGSWFGLIAGIFLVPVYLFYFLLEKQGIERRWTEYLPVRQSGFKDELVFCLRAVNDYLIVFFRSQVLVALCDGALYTLGFLVIGLPYAFLLGLMATLLTMIPFLGAIATCVAALLIAFGTSGSWQLPALVVAVFAVVQTIEGLVISPKIMGDRVGLHPLTIIIAVMVGTTLLGGLLGGILAIPFTAALRVIMFRYVWRKTYKEAPAAA